MAQEIVVISSKDIDDLMVLRDQFWTARQKFVSRLYEFALDNLGKEAALDAELRTRGISFNAASDYWDKIAKLILSVDDNGVWVIRDKTQVSRYALIMRGAYSSKTENAPEKLLDKLEAIGIENTIQEFRKRLNAAGRGKMLEDKTADEYLSVLGTGIAQSAGRLVRGTYKLDIDSLGIDPGLVEVVGKVDDEGNLQLHAIIPATEDELKPRLARLFKERQPLERNATDLLNEIVAIAKAMPKGAQVQISNVEKTGVNVLMMAEDTAGTFISTITSPHFDEALGSLECGVDVADLVKLGDIEKVYGKYARYELSPRGGALFVNVYPVDAENLNKANEAAQAGKQSLKKIKAQPKWITDGTQRYDNTPDKTPYRNIKFEKRELKPVAGPVADAATVAKSAIGDLVKSAKANEQQNVSINGGEFVIGKGTVLLDTLRFAKLLTRVKGLTDRLITIRVGKEGVQVEATKQDYTWTMFQPSLKAGK